MSDDDRRPTDPSAPVERDRADTDPSGSRSAPDRRPTNPSASVGAGRQRAETAVGKKPPPPGKERSSRRGIPDEHVGKVLTGKYRIDKLIAKGGMGRVYQATQFPLERPVAIKILNAEYQRSDPQFVKRFFMEAAIAAKLSHPHTITVFDYGEGDDGELYIAMELLKGRSLSRVISRDGPFDAASAIRISMQVCRAVREAHDAGIIHRDLKPGNVFILDDGGDTPYAKVLDFGLVKLFTPERSEDEGEDLGNLLGKDPELTRTGTLLGSPKYMSPEQIHGLRLDPRTDIYSFGVILYHMMTGKPPFTGATGVDVIYKHVNHPVPPLSSASQEVDVPVELEAIIFKCLEKKREQRYSSMNELIGYLKEALHVVTNTNASNPSIREASFRENIVDDPTPTGLVAADAPSGPQHRPSRIPLALAGLGFVVALGTLIYVLAVRGPTDEPPPIPAETKPLKIAEPIPVAPAAPPVVSPPPAAAIATPPPEQPEHETPETGTAHVGSKKRKKKKNARPQRPPPAVDEPDEPKDGRKVDLPPAYRDNPY